MIGLGFLNHQGFASQSIVMQMHCAMQMHYIGLQQDNLK